MAISGWGVFLIILVIVLIFGGGGYVLYVKTSINLSNNHADSPNRYAHYRARKLGLPPPNFNPFAKKRSDNVNYRAPAPAPGGIQGWITDKLNSLRSGRTAGGAYESTSRGAGRNLNERRGFGALDPDEAWDARVGSGTGADV